MALVPGKVYLIYIPKNNGNSEIVIRDVEPRAYQAAWLNPRTGTVQELDAAEMPRSKRDGWVLPRPTDDMDWVFVLRAE